MEDDFGDWEDFAFIGGAFGFLEEQLEEERIFDRFHEEFDPDEDGLI